jgi:hypothetical protein
MEDHLPPKKKTGRERSYPMKKRRDLKMRRRHQRALSISAPRREKIG